MEETAKIPKGVLGSPIDYKILVIIFALAVGYHILLYYGDESQFNITDALYLTGLFACGVAGLMVAKRYRGSQVFGKAYFFLGLGFISWFIGDLGYYYNNFVLQVDPYPSPFDVGYIGFYVFASLHLLLNTRYFRRQWSVPMKVLLVVLPIVVIATYSIVAYQEWGDYEELPFDLFYGDIFTAGAAVTLAFAILGASVFRQSVLKEVWLLLAIGIFLSTIADVWYVYTEIFEAFDNVHPINTIWMAAFMIIVYALYKHQKVI